MQLFFLLIYLILSSCIASTKGLNQDITLISKDAKNFKQINNATCEVFTGSSVIKKGQAPLYFSLPRGKITYYAKCTHPLYASKIIAINPSVDRQFYDNLINPITIIPGLIDRGLGADMSYPQVITVLLKN